MSSRTFEGPSQGRTIVDMIKNYLTVALRGIRRQKLYAAINVFGLALGMASCIVMLAFVRHEFAYDAFHAEADDVYRVNIRAVDPGGDVNVQAGQPLPLASTISSEIPEVTAATHFRTSDVLVSAAGGESFHEPALYTEPSFFEVFSFVILEGADPLALPHSVAVTESTARKYFRGESAVGQALRISNGGAFQDFTVSAVLEDPPDASSIKFDFLLPMQRWPAYEASETNWSSWGVNTFVRVIDGPPTSAQLASFAAAHYGPMIQTWQILQWLADEEGAFRLELQPLASIHFTPDVELSHTPTINPDYLYILLGLAVIVLLVACVNFATLAVGRSTKRAREVGLRKVLGAARGQLMLQFWGEAVWMSLLALVVGIGLAEALLPLVSEATNRTVDIDYLRDAWALAGVILLAVVTGLVAGFYPALHLSHFRPVEAFRAGHSSRRGSGWIQALVVGQFACSIFIIAAVLIGSSQLRYLKQKSLGFDQERIMVVPTHSSDQEASARLVEVLDHEFRSLPGTASVTAASFAFNHALAWNSFNVGETGHTVYLSRVRPGFVETMQMQLDAGRAFSEGRAADETGSIVVNEAFVRDFDLQDPVGRQLTGVTIGRIENPTIVGVVKDYHFQSLYESIQPMALFTGSDYSFGYMYVRLRSGDVAAHMNDLKSVWERVVTDRPFTGYFLDEDFDRLYRTEERWQQIVSWASVLTLLIACLGLFGLATFSAQRRAKEIGIRKVLGADTAGLAALLSKDFVRLVLVSFVIAAPAAYLVMKKWLDDFAYHVSIQPQDLLAAGAIAVIIALVTVSYQALRAASADPVTTLRNE